MWNLTTQIQGGGWKITLQVRNSIETPWQLRVSLTEKAPYSNRYHVFPSIISALKPNFIPFSLSLSISSILNSEPSAPCYFWFYYSVTFCYIFSFSLRFHQNSMTQGLSRIKLFVFSREKAVATEQVTRYCKNSDVYKQEDPWQGIKKVIGTHLKQRGLNAQESLFISCISSQPKHIA